MAVILLLMPAMILLMRTFQWWTESVSHLCKWIEREKVIAWEECRYKPSQLGDLIKIFAECQRTKINEQNDRDKHRYRLGLFILRSVQFLRCAAHLPLQVLLSWERKKKIEFGLNTRTVSGHPMHETNRRSDTQTHTHTVLGFTSLFSCLTHFPILLFKHRIHAVQLARCSNWPEFDIYAHTRIRTRMVLVKPAQNLIDANVIFFLSRLCKTDSVFVCRVITGGRIVIICSKNNTVWFRWN